MVIDPRNNYLVTGPSISPENSFRHQGQEFCASMMPTCDRVLAYEIFSACLQSTEILNVDASFADSLRTAISQLPPFRISTNGGVQEWFEDYEEAHPNHRHTTHLLSLYPYSQITLDKTPELAQAAAKTIEKRLAAKDWEDTEWSRANMICFYARLKDSEKAYSSVKQLLGKLSRENMFTVSRPESPEQVKIFSPSTEIQPEQQVWQKCYCKVMIIASNYCLVCRKNGKTEVSKDFVRVEVSK